MASRVCVSDELWNAMERWSSQRVENVLLRHYNAMLKGAYDLLLAKQNEVTTERDYVEAWRDYWIAD